MPIIITPLRLKQKGPRIKTLHDELSVLGSTLAAGERRTKVFGSTTRRAVTEFQTQVGVEPTGVVDQVTGRLMTSAVRFGNEGSSLGLRQELRAAVKQNPKAPELAYWLARYELLAGDYVAAHTAIRNVSAVLPAAALIDQVLAPPDPSKPALPPEVPYPANFYTYHNEWLPQADIDRLRDELRQLKNADIQPADNTQDADFRQAVRHILDAIAEWQEGNQNAGRLEYARAIANYGRCQRAVSGYFAVMDGFQFSGGENRRLIQLIMQLSFEEQDRAAFWARLRRRRGLLSLGELFDHDWKEPVQVGGVPFASALQLVRFLQRGEFSDPSRVPRQGKLEATLVTLACVLVPLARAEVNRLRRQFDAAIRDLRWVLNPFFHEPVTVGDLLPPGGVISGLGKTFDLPADAGRETHLSLTRRFRMACEFIEIPFARQLLAQTLLDKADNEYKARQNQQAADTYTEVQQVLAEEGSYLQRVQAGKDRLTAQVEQALNRTLHPLSGASTPAQRRELLTLGKDLPVDTIEVVGQTLPGLDRRSAPHESLVKITVPAGQAVLKETNPLIYALLLEAQARLLQIASGFNYLGYKDDYIPPWRFQFLLERARYFAEHAKNTQREYLNFLGNAEQEEFQELSAAQNVTLEKSNVRIETARTEQARLEVETAKLSQELAQLAASDAQARLDGYSEMSNRIADLEAQSFTGSLLTGLGSVAVGAATGGPAGGIAGTLGFLGGTISQSAEIQISAEQRAFEEFNLGLAVKEAAKAAEVASAQFAVAKAGLVVAGLQRGAALLRHEFAIQNLNFLRNRTLNAELWYRLSGMIRSVSETYMRYAVELSFLAEQAYEFEADKRINVIHFDYDVSEIGSLLAADFLMRDLDTLEQDLIVNQRQRQQQVRYVLSLAREFPEALQDLRDNGFNIFSLRLEQIERRFAGLFNVRIGAVDVTPIALMDPTRFSLEMTYLGSSQVRLKAQPDTPPGVDSQSPLNTNQLQVQSGGWLAEVQQEWPVRIRVTGPETTVFSGLSRPDRATVFPFVSTSQRDAFEGLGAAAAWRIDMSMKENQVVPGTLADVLITFTLSGYYDRDLRAAVDVARREAATLTQLLSARQRFADAFYEFNHSGRMTWEVSASMLSLDVPVRNLRNLGILLLPASRPVQFRSLMSAYTVELDVAADGQFEVLTPIPEIAFAINQLALTAAVNGADGATVSWDFGEGGGFQSTSQHTFSRPGKYEIVLRLVKNGRLHEYRVQIAVSRTQTLATPLTAFPSFAPAPPGQIGILAGANALPAEEVNVIWKVDQGRAERARETLLGLPAGTHVVTFTAVRKLRARIYSQQRFVSDRLLALDGLRISTNRVFELDGTETTGTGQNDLPNALTEHLFPEDPSASQRLALSPADRWTLELSLDDNPFLRSVTANDNIQILLDDLEDAILILEYETGSS